MNTNHNTELAGYCDGCECKCKYGYVRKENGQILPTVAGIEFDYQILPDGKITKTSVSTPLAAQRLAHAIAQTCDRHK